MDWSRENTITAYGQTFRERYPDMPPNETAKITHQRTPLLRILIASLLTGAITGIAANLLRFCIGYISSIINHAILKSDITSANTSQIWLFLLPLSGILLTDLYQHYLLHRQINYGEYRLLYDFAKHRSYLPLQLTYAPLIASSITLGFGGSAGSEGPIAYSGAAIGSNIGAYLRLAPTAVRYLTAIGAGAGIAGIFKAPIGGAMFSLEIIGISMSPTAIYCLFAACLTASATAGLLSGNTINLTASSSEFTAENIPFLLLFGVFCGLYSWYFSGTMTFTRRSLDKITGHWTKPIVAGAIVGLTVFLFPSLYGEGYNIVEQLLNLQQIAIQLSPTKLPTIILTAIGLMLLKSVATSATNNGGGVAGDFAPTIMIGSIAGFLFAFVLNHYCYCQLPISDFVIMGMAGVMAGVVKAPLMAIFLITETATMGYGMILPVAIVAAVSYLSVRGLNLICRKPQLN